MAKIIHTDNFGGDYPGEKFVEQLPVMNDNQAKVICDAINSMQPENAHRWYRVVPNDYKLQPGFEP